MAVLRVVQCWDDGVISDIRLSELLREFGAKATFNLNPGLHGEERKLDEWRFKGVSVGRLSWGELRSVYSGFEIANHTLTHPSLPKLGDEDLAREIGEGRDRLRQHFQAEIRGFAYPFGHYDARAMRAVRSAGHNYARTVGSAADVMSAEDAMALHPSCHFCAEDFWQRYESSKESGVFYFWGHSFELVDDAMWESLRAKLVRIADDPQSLWTDLSELFPVRER